MARAVPVWRACNTVEGTFAAPGIFYADEMKVVLNEIEDRSQPNRAGACPRRGEIHVDQARLSGRACGSPLLEAFTAEHRTTLRRPERNCGFLSTLRTSCLGFRALEIACARCLRALRLAVFAPFGLVLETLVGVKHLLTGGEDKLLIALRALQDLIVVFHTLLRGSAFGLQSPSIPVQPLLNQKLPPRNAGVNNDWSEGAMKSHESSYWPVRV